MASITKGNDENRAREGQRAEPAKPEPKAEIVKADSDREEKGEARQLDYARPGAARRGFFTIYKSGQGYWTRMGTLAGVALLGIMLAYTLYIQIPVYFASRQVGIGVAVGFFVIYTLVALRMMNKPANVDFLIATDSEMKKVNWTSRKELVGSTKVVVLFMFIIAGFLFAMDIIFAYFFKFIGVLRSGPFG